MYVSKENVFFALAPGQIFPAGHIYTYMIVVGPKKEKNKQKKKKRKKPPGMSCPGQGVRGSYVMIL